jgi:hypothetical protein
VARQHVIKGRLTSTDARRRLWIAIFEVKSTDDKTQPNSADYGRPESNSATHILLSTKTDTGKRRAEDKDEVPNAHIAWGCRA